MEKKINYLLEEFKNDIISKQEEVERIEKEPLIFFTALTSKRSGIIPMLLEEHGEEMLLDYQRFIYPKVLRALKEKFSIDKFLLSYEETIFPSPIQLTFDGEKIAEIYPYEKVLFIPTKDRVKNLLKTKKELEEIMEKLEKEVEVRKIEEANPLILGGNNPFKLLNIAFTMKKTKNKIRKHARTQLSELSQVRQDLISADVELEGFEKEQIHSSVELDRVANRLYREFGFRTERESERFNSDDENTENTFEKENKTIEEMLEEQDNLN